MKFVYIGISHQDLNIDERKAFHFYETDKFSFSIQLLNSYVKQILILSTCNRSEFYVICDDDLDENILKNEYLSYFNQSNDFVHIKKDKEALNYLLQVACGLKSMVIGEDQILHQIKEALNWTINQKFGGKELYYIFKNVISFAKDMKSKYAISEIPLSVSYIGYQCLKKYIKPNNNIMICGIGEMAQLMIKYLEELDYNNLYIVNRTYEKVTPFLNEKVKYIPFKDRYNNLDKMDIVISATSSPHYIFNAEKIKINKNKNVVFLDLSMPRDIDINIKFFENTKLIDMDDLKHISNEHLQKRINICENIKNECFEKVSEILKSLDCMKNDFIIKKMQEKYISISEETLEILKDKINLSHKDERVLQKILKASFLKLMKQPIDLLKSENSNEYRKVLEKILEIEEDEL